MVAEDQPIREIEIGELLPAVSEFHKNGYRLVHVTCTKEAEGKYELTYGFDKEFKLESLRIKTSPESEIPSITLAYWGAFLYENEINELFGMNIKGMNVDYRGHLYKKKVSHPFSMSMKKVDVTCPKK